MSDYWIGELERQAARALVRYAAGRAIVCPDCDEVLDCERAVVMSDDTHTVVRCALCYGHPVGNLKSGTVTVYDGRALFNRSRSAKREWRYA